MEGNGNAFRRFTSLSPFHAFRARLGNARAPGMRSHFISRPCRSQRGSKDRWPRQAALLRWRSGFPASLRQGARWTVLASKRLKKLSHCQNCSPRKSAAARRRARLGARSSAGAVCRRRASFELRFAHCAPRRQRLYRRALPGRLFARGRRWALSSAVEHYLDMVGVRGSIPLAPTISKRILASRRAGSPPPRRRRWTRQRRRS